MPQEALALGVEAVFKRIEQHDPKLRAGAQVIVLCGEGWAPGVVTKVHGSGLINATVFQDGQAVVTKSSLPKALEDGTPPVKGTWKFYTKCNH